MAGGGGGQLGCLRVFTTTVSAFTGTKGQTGANCLSGMGDAAGLTQHFASSSSV